MKRDLGEVLWAMRLHKGMSRREAGAAIGVSGDTIQNWETGLCRPTQPTALADAYGFPEADLWRMEAGKKALPPPSEKPRKAGRPNFTDYGGQGSLCGWRDEAIAMRRAGKTLKEIGTAIGVSKQRVSQVLQGDWV